MNNRFIILLLCFFSIHSSFAMQKQKFSAAYESAIMDAHWPADSKVRVEQLKIKQDEAQAVKAATTKALAFCLAQQAQYADSSFFNHIERAVKQSPHRMDDWSQAKKLSEEQMTRATDCHTSASFLRDLLKDHNVASFTPAALRPLRSDTMEYAGNFKSFVQTDHTGLRKDAVANALFEKGSKRAVFHAIIGWTEQKPQSEKVIEASHSFIIEKLSGFDACAVKYRIYQSYFRAFSLAQWLGIDPWMADWTYKSAGVACLGNQFNTQHQKYGKGQEITAADLYDFIVSYEKNARAASPKISGVKVQPYFYCSLINSDENSLK